VFTNQPSQFQLVRSDSTKGQDRVALIVIPVSSPIFAGKLSC